MLGALQPGAAQRAGERPTEAPVLRDPDIPVAGNRRGDITIVECFDYQCPYCRKVEPELRQVVQDDGKVRLVLKDWPILGPVSVVAARMALACKYQDKFREAHDAMIGVNSKLTEPRIRELLSGAGIDVDRAKRDLAANAKAIDAILARNNDQADRAAASTGRRPSSSANSACRASSPWRNSDRSSPTRERRRRQINRRNGTSRERRCPVFTPIRGYFDDILIQSSWACCFSACQSLAAMSQFTMVRLACAT